MAKLCPKGKAAAKRKRVAGNTGPKPTFVKTFTKKYYGGMINTGDKL
jgi:hypothetical protein